MLSTKQKFLPVLMAACLFSTNALSADIARELRLNNGANTAPDNFLELGLGVAAGIAPSLTEDESDFAGLTLHVQGSYNYRGFFIDLAAETSEPILMGYNAYNSNNWSFDIVLANTGDGITHDTDDKFKDIDEREASNMLGGRVTGYIDGNILQFSLKQDVSGRSKGMTANALIGRNWQYRNWNFHGLLGVSYSNEKFANYYLGVSEEEAQGSDFTSFDTGANLEANASIGVTYPISEDWIFRATAAVSTSSWAKDNPLFETKRSSAAVVGASISYVF